jgi:hypothetical protein
MSREKEGGTTLKSGMQRRWARPRLAAGAKMEARQSLSSFYLIGDGKGCVGGGVVVDCTISQSLLV